MKKKPILVLASSLLTGLLAGCGTTDPMSSSSEPVAPSSSVVDTSSPDVPSSEEPSSEVPSSEEPSSEVPSSSPDEEPSFADLYAELQKGYKAQIVKTVAHSDGSDPDYYGLKASLIAEALDVDVYSKAYDSASIFQKSSTHHHLEKQGDLATEVGIGIANEPIYTDIPSLDPITSEVYENFLWDDAKLDYVFASIPATSFHSDDGTNYSLDLTGLSDDVKGSLARQVFPNFSTTYNSGSYVAAFDDREVKSLSIAINDGAIASISIACEDYTYDPGRGTPDTRSEAILMTIEETGAEATSKLTSLDGTAIKSFDDKIASLAARNYEVEESIAYDDDWMGSGVQERVKIKSYNGASYSIDVLDTADETKTTARHIYHQDGDSYLSLSLHGDSYYAASPLTKGSLSDLIPLAKVSSVFFVKDEENSTQAKEVYKLNGLYSTSIKEEGAILNPGLYDGQSKYISDLSVEFDGESIRFKNVIGIYTQTITFSNIGGVTEFIPSYEASCDALHYDDLIDLDAAKKEALLSLIPEASLDTIPVPGGHHSYATVDSSSSSKMTIYFETQTEEDLNSLFADLKDKFVQASYSEIVPEEGEEDEDKYQYSVASILSGETPLTLSAERDWNQYTNVGKFYLTFSF